MLVYGIFDIISIKGEIEMTPAYEPWARPIETLGLKKQDLSLLNPSEEDYFFKTKTDEIFPYYKEDIYKAINVFKPSTFLPLFKELDIPFYEEIWLELIQRQMKCGNQLSFVFGKYLAKMKLFDFKKATFRDSNKFFIDVYEYDTFIYVPKIIFQIGEEKWN
jgi:hypothetical protein